MLSYLPVTLHGIIVEFQICTELINVLLKMRFCVQSWWYRVYNYTWNKFPILTWHLKTSKNQQDSLEILIKIDLRFFWDSLEILKIFFEDYSDASEILQGFSFVVEILLIWNRNNNDLAMEHPVSQMSDYAELLCVGKVVF